MPCYQFKNTSKPFTTTLGSIFALFKIQMKFGRIHQIFSFLFLSLPFSLQTRSRVTLAGYSLSLSLILLVLCTWTQKEGGSPRQSCQDLTPFPLSHSTPLQPPTSFEQPPRRVPGPHLQATHLPYLTPPLSCSPRPPRARSCRPGRRSQASPCDHATRAH
jgi:hypothetical protein